jgi:uncharacterized protein (TIGR02147 family)
MEIVQDYRSMLREELTSRIKTNPRYSARAMARDIGLSPGFFCQVLNQRRLLHEDRALAVANALGWDERRASSFVKLVRFHRVKDTSLKRTVLDEINREQSAKAAFYDLELDYFTAISRWEYLAILDLVTTEGFKSDPRWIANKLGITKVEADTALDRLKRLGMLVADKNELRRSHPNYATPNGPGSDSLTIKDFHAQLLKKAKEALYQQPRESIEFRNLTVATDPKRLPEIKRRIREFEDELMNLMESGRRKQVFQFSMQLFPLVKD